MKGIEYKNDDNQSRGIVQSYHSSGRMGFNEHFKGAKTSDIKQLKKKEKVNILNDGVDGDFKSKFTIGFEIEKKRMQRSAVKQYPLIAGFERDSSCGYEAVTHILPLLPKSIWRNKVYNMMFEARKIIEDEFSPSDYKCGGHISVGADGYDGYQLFNLVRPNIGILYALFRKRLKNTYCSADIRMDDAYSDRYSAVNKKSRVLEFRLVSRFQSVKQMMRRYELMYELMDFSINNPNGNFNTLLKRVEPIIRLMYEGDEDKVKMIMQMAKDFRMFVNLGKSTDLIRDFIPQSQLED